MKRMIITTLAALFLLSAPMAVLAQAQAGGAAPAGTEQPAKGKKAKKHAKKGKSKKGKAKGAPEAETK